MESLSPACSSGLEGPGPPQPVRPPVDLTDPAERERVTRHLSERWAGRPVILGPAVLAAWTPYVAWFRALGCPVLVVATSRGAGPLPGPGECTVVDVALPPTASVTEELRLHDRLAHALPDHARAAIDAFDPGRQGVWATTHFVTDDDPIDLREVTHGRPAAFLALEDKMLADAVWEAADVTCAPHRVVEAEDRANLATAVAEVGTEQGAVLSGDARDGFNGGGNFVRWVRDGEDLAAAVAFFAARCDRVRVLPFLEGVPCSIHGFVLPGGTATFRPVEIAVLRDPGRRIFVYGGIGSTWDPPDPDREDMRDAVRRVGAHLRAEHGYRGAFGIDGVLTAEGFRPTELNTRASGGLGMLLDFDRPFAATLQAALVEGRETGVTAADLEALVPLMDQHRHGKVVALSEDVSVAGDESYPLSWDGQTFMRADGPTGNLLSIGQTPSGCFAKVDPCSELVRGQRLAPLNVGLLGFMDRTYGTSFGAVEAAPDVRPGVA